MRMRQFIFIKTLAILLLFISYNNTTLGQEYTTSPDKCTVVIVGKKASTDGSVMSTHTCDCGLCDWTWRYRPPADHEPGTTRKIYWFDQFGTTPPSKGLKWDNLEDNFSDIEINEVENTLGYIHGMFGYMNDN